MKIKEWKVATILGIPLEIHFTFLMLLVWVMLAFFFSTFKFGLEERFAISLTAAILFFSCMLMHELSHCWVAVRNKLRIKRMLLCGIGIIGEPEGTMKNWLAELKITAAGPIVGLLIVFFLFVLSLFSLPAPLHFLVAILIFSILFNNIFNLLPIFPLDGGRILRALLWRKKEVKKATQTALSISKVVSFVPFILGIYVFYYQPRWQFWGATIVNADSAGLFAAFLILLSFLLWWGSELQGKKEMTKLTKEVRGDV